MALNKAKLAVDLENAFKIAQNNPSPTSQTDIAQAIATAIHTYYIGATVNTLIDICVANGGVNASIPPPSGPTPGPITAPATVKGVALGTLS